MKKSDLTFEEGFLGTRATEAAKNKAIYMAFDWDKAAGLIKKAIKQDASMVAEAGLEGDWNYTGGCIFQEGKPTNDFYTFLQSNWAIPTLILTVNKIPEEIPCWVEGNERFSDDTKWDEISLEILGIQL